MSVERDMLELMVAYGFVPLSTIAGGRPAAPVSDSPAPRRSEGVVSITLAAEGRVPGAGQSTLIVGLAHAWSRAGRSVLLVDLDPADELGRLLLVGSALTVNTGHAVLRAANAGGSAEPSHTLLPGVDVVLSGGWTSWDPDALPGLLRRRPDALADALRAVRGRYDRVLIDAPGYPGALAESARRAADATLLVLPADALPDPLPTGIPEGGARTVRPLLGIALTRFDHAAPPTPAALEALAAAGAWSVAIPRFDGLTSPWDAVAGTAGTRADAAFRALAAAIDSRVASLPAFARETP
jgi:hypothetical protein